MTARLGATYLFSGRARSEGGRLVAQDGALSPVRDLILYAEDPGKNGVACWKTDGKGLLYPLAKGAARPGAVHYLGKKRRVYLPPPDALLKAWAKSREEWAEGLAKGIAARSYSYAATELTEIQVPKKALREPDRASGEEAEKEWAKFYDGLPESAKLFAWVLPRTRALVMPFASAAGVSSVEVTPPGKGAIACRVRREGERAFAVAMGDEHALPAGMYRFSVGVSGAATGAWSPAVARERRYQLKEQVRFGITNFAGEFEIVSCDPISVEESVLQQFPALYWHRIAAAKKRSDYPEVGTDPEYADFPKALEQWAERMEWAQSKAKLTVGLVNASGWNKRAQMLGKVVWNELKPPADDEYLSAARGSIDLAFQVRGQVKEWKEILEGLEAEKELQGLKRVLWKDLQGHFEKYRWWEWAKQEFIDGDKQWRVLELASATEAERKVILKAGIPEKRTNLEEALGEGAGGAIQKGLVAAQTAIDFYQAAVAFSDVLESRKEEKDLVSDLDELLGQVEETLAREACREAIGNLERMRAATVAAHEKLGDDEAKALMAAVDAVLGVLTLVFPPLAIVVAVKETLSLAKDVAVDLGEWLDRIALKGWAADLYARQWAQMAALARSSGANQSLMPKVGKDGGASDLNVQLRLRAEALHGLVGLLTRASVSSKDEKDYLERVGKYRVAEYVQHYLLGDGWQLPIRPLVPIGMDAAWLYLTSPFGGLLTEAAVAEQLGFSSPLQTAAVGSLPMGMTMLTAVDSVLAGNAVARFQKTFPIHRTDATVPELAKAFRTAWKELDAGAVESTCVYRRDPGGSGREGWKAVNGKGAKSVDQLDLLSPLDQIRVLVVFKDSVAPGCYPLSFQLYRVDGIDIAGPVYREVTRRLDKDRDLLPDEAKFHGRIGCVFYPFFELGKQMIPGIKPLARFARFAGAGAYELFGYLDDMRYAFRLQTGDSSDKQWLKIGAAQAGTSDLDELRVGLTGKPQENQLLVAGFLDSHSEKMTYPLLFQGTSGFGPCYIRVGGGAYQLATPEQDATLTFDGYDWKQPVELVVVAWSSMLAWNDWEKMGLDWTRVPVSIQLANLKALGHDDGPKYTSTLNYLGELSTAPAGLASATSAPEKEIGDWAAQVRKSPAELQKLVRAVDPKNFGSAKDKDSSYHLFAAHFDLDYVLPGGQQVQGLRPFGRLLNAPEPYRIAVRKLQAIPDSNLQQDTLESAVSDSWISGSGYARPEYEFRFRAPAWDSRDLPWASLSAEQRKKWIEDEAKKRDAHQELIAK